MVYPTYLQNPIQEALVCYYNEKILFKSIHMYMYVCNFTLLFILSPLSLSHKMASYSAIFSVTDASRPGLDAKVLLIFACSSAALFAFSTSTFEISLYAGFIIQYVSLTYCTADYWYLTSRYCNSFRCRQYTS